MLAGRFPGYVPAPLAVEPERGWFLLPEFDDLLGWDPPLEVHEELFRRYAGLQRRSAGLTAELLADGCLDRRLDVLEAQVDPLLDDPDAVARLMPDEVAELRRLAPALKDACRRLAACGIPDTLVHGDLHPGNVARLDGELAYFDWTDACIAHPFFDLHSLQWQKDESDPGSAARRIPRRVGGGRVTRAPARGRSAGRGRDAAAPRRLLPDDRHQPRAGRQVGARRDAPVPARNPRPDARLANRLGPVDAVLLSSNTESMRPPLPLLVLLLALTLGVSAAQGGHDAVNKPLLGISGQPDRFERQTGQDSQVRQLFLGWGQGSTWGSPFAELFAGLKPIPMIHIGTDRGRARTEVMTPAGIAAGRGDAYLVALNQAIAAYGGQVFVRVMAEMNNPRNLYCADAAQRQLEGAVALGGGVQAGVPARLPDPPRR